MHHTGSSGGIDPGNQETAYIANAIMPGAMQAVTTISNILLIVFGWLSVSVEVFIRYDFGERYLSVMRLFLAGFMMVTLFVLSSAFSATVTFGRTSGPVNLFYIFFIAYIVLAIIHRLKIWLRYQRRIPWHSFSFGTSRLSALNLPVIGHDDWTLYRWYEPILCLVLGWILLRIDRNLGNWIIVSSIALFMKNQMVYFHQRSRILDLIDAQIEGTYYNAAAFGESKSNAAGIAVVKAIWPVLPKKSPFDSAKTVSETMAGNEVANPADDPEADPRVNPTPTRFAGTVASMLGRTEDEEPSDEDPSDEDDK